MHMDRVWLVVMGVSGCGKSSLGAALATALGLPLIEGDDHHPPANVQKMSQGIALTDADRAGWLATLGRALAGAAGRGADLLGAQAHLPRTTARGGARAALRVHGHRAGRIRAPGGGARRRGEHMFPASLVANQFATLESPVGRWACWRWMRPRRLRGRWPM
jgi:gluconokinase